MMLAYPFTPINCHNHFTRRSLQNKNISNSCWKADTEKVLVSWNHHFMFNNKMGQTLSNAQLYNAEKMENTEDISWYIYKFSVRVIWDYVTKEYIQPFNTGHLWELFLYLEKKMEPSFWCWLVVDLPLWKIWKSTGIIIPNLWKNKKCSKPPTSHCYINPYKSPRFPFFPCF